MESDLRNYRHQKAWNIQMNQMMAVIMFSDNIFVTCLQFIIKWEIENMLTGKPFKKKSVLQMKAWSMWECSSISNACMHCLLKMKQM